jgi:hypothetical protein
MAHSLFNELQISNFFVAHRADFKMRLSDLALEPIEPIAGVAAQLFEREVLSQVIAGGSQFSPY